MTKKKPESREFDMDEHMKEAQAEEARERIAEAQADEARNERLHEPPEGFDVLPKMSPGERDHFVPGDPLPEVERHAAPPRGPMVLFQIAEDEVVPAVVVKVHGDGSCNLHVFPNGPRTSFVPSAMRGHDVGCWDDMP